MDARRKNATAGFAVPFMVPYIAGRIYRPGRQPNDPGNSQIDSGSPHFGPIPWPNVVGTVSALAWNPGTPVQRPQGIVNNAYSVSPSNYMFIAGVVGKSMG